MTGGTAPRIRYGRAFAHLAMWALVLMSWACRSAPESWCDEQVRTRLREAPRRDYAAGIYVALELPPGAIAEELPLELDRGEFERSVIGVLEQFDVFARIEPIAGTFPGLDRVKEGSHALDDELVDRLRERSLDLFFYISVSPVGKAPLGSWSANSATVPSLLLWPLLGFPSLFMRDREYETGMTCRIDAYDVDQNRKLPGASAATGNIDVSFVDRVGLAGWLLVPICPSPWTPHDGGWMRTLLEGVIAARLSEELAWRLKSGEWDARPQTIDMVVHQATEGLPRVDIYSNELVKNLYYRYDVTRLAVFPEEDEVTAVPDRAGFRYRTMATLPGPATAARWLRVIVETDEGRRLSKTFRLLEQGG